jgi:transcriptional regulator with XRE-family HTH domain
MCAVRITRCVLSCQPLDIDNLTMHSERPSNRRRAREASEMLSPAELGRLERGAEWKRYIRAAAALREMYDDTAIAEAVGRTRIAVGRWWQGARPEPDTLLEIARATDLSPGELATFVYYDGPPPRLAGCPESAVESGVEEGIRRDRERPPLADPPEPAQSPAPPPRDRRGEP